MNDNCSRRLFDRAAWTAGLLSLVLLNADAAAADRNMTQATNAQWRSECGSCHVPYPPQLLPARSWRAIMAQLDRHFGSDATLDPKSFAEISAYLETNAGRDPRVAKDPPVLRITETGWFAREHSEIGAAIFIRSKVKRSDCAACHRDAANGAFGEHTLQLPQ